MAVKSRLKNYFLSGLIILTPLAATVVIIGFLFSWTSGFTNILIDAFDLTSLTYRMRILAQVGVLLGIGVFIGLIGFIAHSSVGRRVLGGFGRLVNLLHLYRSLYHSIKHMANSLVENKSRYRSAVVVEYPSEGIYRLGFLTSGAKTEINQAVEEDLVNVYLPNSPTPTAGQTVMVPREEAKEVDLTIKEAFKIIITTGISSKKSDEIMPE